MKYLKNTLLDIVDSVVNNNPFKDENQGAFDAKLETTQQLMQNIYGITHDERYWEKVKTSGKDSRLYVSDKLGPECKILFEVLHTMYLACNDFLMKASYHPEYGSYAGPYELFMILLENPEEILEYKQKLWKSLNVDVPLEQCSLMCPYQISDMRDLRLGTYETSPESNKNPEYPTCGYMVMWGDMYFDISYRYISDSDEDEDVEPFLEMKKKP